MLTTVTNSIKPVLSVMMISVIMFSVLGILGMQLMSGKLVHCSDNTIFRREDCVNVSATGVKRQWEVESINYDWFGSALLSVYGFFFYTFFFAYMPGIYVAP